jgi:hypothetical protein
VKADIPMNMRRLTFVLVAAVITELLFLALFLFTESGNAGGIWIPNLFQMAYIYFHIPAKAIVQNAGCDDFPHFFVWGLITETI